MEYRPDQVFLDTVEPVYTELEPWDVETLHKAKSSKDLPKQAKAFVAFLEKELGVPAMVLTTGPERAQTIFM